MPDGATRRVSLHEPDARPIAKGRLGRPEKAGKKRPGAGDLAVTRETYVTAELDERDPFLQHIQELCRVRRDDGATGASLRCNRAGGTMGFAALYPSYGCTAWRQ